MIWWRRLKNQASFKVGPVFFFSSVPAKATAAPRPCHMCCLQGLLHLPVKTSAS